MVSNFKQHDCDNCPSKNHCSLEIQMRFLNKHPEVEGEIKNLIGNLGREWARTLMEDILNFTENDSMAVSMLLGAVSTGYCIAKGADIIKTTPEGEGKESNIDKLVDMAKEISKRVVEDLGGEHQLFLITDSFSKVGAIAPLGHLPEKVLRTAVLAALQAVDATGYVLVGEATLVYGKYVDKVLKDDYKDIPLDDISNVIAIQSCEKGDIPKILIATVGEREDKRTLGEFKETRDTFGILGLSDINNW